MTSLPEFTSSRSSTALWSVVPQLLKFSSEKGKLKMGQLFSVLRSWQCFGAECHSTCMDDCCTFDFHRDAQASEEEELDLPYIHYRKQG